MSADNWANWAYTAVFVAWAIWGWDAVLVAGIGCFVAVLVVSSVYQGE